jgi:CO/xanthine dehydrogenase FAD-binding subunit
MQEFDFVSPVTLEEACRALVDGGGRLVAGGTDVIPQMLNGRFRAGRLVDLSRLCGLLSYIEPREEWITIGALTTYTEIVNLPCCRPAPCPGSGCRRSLPADPQPRTLGGNLGNASPAGDTLPPLLALDARVTLAGLDGERTVPLQELLLGPGQTAIEPGEVIREVSFKCLPGGANSVFLKLSSRQGMAVSVVSAAVVLGLDAKGRGSLPGLALGAVAPVAMRAPEAEALLLGQPIGEAHISAAAEAASRFCNPITDVRGTAEYRRYAVQVLVRRGLRALAYGERAGSGPGGGPGGEHE